MSIPTKTSVGIRTSIESILIRLRVIATNVAANATSMKIKKLLSNTHALAVLDQILVSGTSFLTILLIGRLANSNELGDYSLAISVVASMQAVQNALILLPYSIQRHNGEQVSDRAGNSLALSGFLSALAAAAIAAVALGSGLLDANSEVSKGAWALVLFVPFALLREFARRYAFAHLQVSTALAIDAAVAVIQLAGLCYLALSHAIDAISACATLGLACALPTLLSLYFLRAQFSMRRGELGATATQSWQLGKWLLLGQLTSTIQSYAAYWLIFLISGASVTGIYAACMSIIAFANPAIFGVANILTPKLALAWKRGGSAGVQQEAWRSLLLLAGLMSVFCLGVATVGDTVMRVMFHGSEYIGHGQTMTILAVAVLAMAVGLPASNALASMERPRAIVIAGGLGAVITVVMIAYLMTNWGLLGAAFGYLIGNIVGASGRWAAFLSIVRKARDTAPADDLLRSVAAATPYDAIVRVGEGDHASVFAVGAADVTLHGATIVKLYKAGSNPNMPQVQFEQLMRVQSVLHGQAFGAWTFQIPRPIAVYRAPLALTMTTVGGKSIDSCVADGCMDSDMLSTAAHAFAAGMLKLWEQRLVHGDFGLRNTLFDTTGRTLALIDPGTIESCDVCDSAGRGWRAAAVDLGHLIAELATDVNDMVGNPTARMHKQAFVVTMLRSVLLDTASFTERGKLIKEIRQCAAAHLTSMLAPSWSLRGVWHSFVKYVAERRIADIFRLIEYDERPARIKARQTRTT